MKQKKITSTMQKVAVDMINLGIVLNGEVNGDGKM